MRKILKNRMFYVCMLLVIQIRANTELPKGEIDPTKTPSAAEIVEKQLKAYNLRDLEGFLACFSEDVEVYMFPDQLLFQGKDQLKNGYKTFFESTPDLYGELLDRSVSGNKVKDELNITRIKKTKPIKTTVIYLIEEGLIKKMYFVS